MLPLYLIIFLIQIHLFLFEIIIPFKTIKEEFQSDNPSTFMYYYFPNKIETIFKIGTPSQEIPLIIKTLPSPISINSVQMGVYKTVRFNESNSSSYISISERPSYFGEYDFKQALKSKDIITFNNNGLTLNNFTFLLGVTDNQHLREGGVLGLNIADFDWRIKDVGFIKQLKERNLIKKNNFFIHYNKNDDTGNLIIDKLPHEIYPKIYDKNKYEEFYAEIVSSTLGLKASEAYYGDTLIDCEFQIQLALEQNFIRGTPAFKSVLMEKFFKEKITRKICQSSVFSYLDSEAKDFIYCNKKLNLSEFNNIVLSINNTEFKIELNYSDLFYEYNDNYYFMIYFPSQTHSYYFIIGKTLFKKYTLTFNHETKRIGYYKEDNSNNHEMNGDNNKKEYYYLIPWIIIGVLVIIILLLGFYIIYYKPCKNRTKRANELQDENYTYKEINNND